MKLTTHSSLMGHALLLVAGMIFNNHAVALSATLTDVNPDWSSRDATAAWGVASGGRVNGLAIDRANRSVGYAASEWGGLYKTVDGGLTWSHLPGHTAMTTWDVEVDPGNSQHVYASSFHDGRTSIRAALNVSDNAGKPGWLNPYYGDVFDIRATDNHVARTRRDPRIFVVSDLDFKNDRVINNLPGFSSACV